MRETTYIFMILYLLMLFVALMIANAPAPAFGWLLGIGFPAMTVFNWITKKE